MSGTSFDRIAGLSSSVAIKAPCDYYTTANIALSGLAVQAGGSWAAPLTQNDNAPTRVLVKNQTNAVDNGIWNPGAGTWQRARDFDGARDVVQATLMHAYQNGTDTFFEVATANPIVIGTTALSIVGVQSSAIADILARLADPTSASNGDAMVAVKSTLAGAVARTQHDKNAEVISVLDFGAVADGAVAAGTGTNNTPFFQAAINALGGRGTLFIPAGVYRLSAQITIPSNITVKGAGNFVTILTCPPSFDDATGLVRLNGAGGPPTVVEDLCVSGPVGGAGSNSAGIVSVANGSFIRNVWVTAFKTNVTLSSTDNFLLGSAIEEAVSGGVAVLVTVPDVTVADCVLYNSYIGLLVQGAAFADGTISISNVRSIACAYIGFYISSSSNVQLSNCSVGHNNFSRVTYAAMNIESSTNVVVSNFIARVGSGPSASSIGIRCLNSSALLLTGCQVSTFLDGIQLNSCSSTTVSSCHATGNSRYGIYSSGGDQVLITGCSASGNGGGGATDAGIYTLNSAGFATYTITGCKATQAGGGPQEYGIFASVTDNGASSGFTNVTGNHCRYNGSLDLAIANKVDNINARDNFYGSMNPANVTVSSASSITLPFSSDVISITGTTGITSITATYNDRRRVTLIFAGALTMTDGSNLKLAGNYTTTADDTITLVCDGTNWYEVSRSAN